MVGRIERNKDLVQDVVENTANRVGNIASIITGAVADVTREIGDLVSDGFEMREAAKAARHDSSEPDPTSTSDAITDLGIDDDDAAAPVPGRDDLDEADSSGANPQDAPAHEVTPHESTSDGRADG